MKGTFTIDHLSGGVLIVKTAREAEQPSPEQNRTACIENPFNIVDGVPYREWCGTVTIYCGSSSNFAKVLGSGSGCGSRSRPYSTQ